MLRVGLTGGIGAGKSTVAQRLVALGAILVDADRLAREAVRPGSEGLAGVAAEFGPRVISEDGTVDRAALARIVFADPIARRRLNSIVHPVVARRTTELIARAPGDAVLVQDIPLLVESAMAPTFPLVVVVHATEEERLRRLVRDRGMAEEDARARIRAQADDRSRWEAADVWLDNSGDPPRLVNAVGSLWRDRLVPFERALRTGVPPPIGPLRLRADHEWRVQADRLAARVTRAVGDRAVRVDHIGSTSVPGMPARDVLDLQLVVPGPDDVEAVVPTLRQVGFLPVDRNTLCSADPGRPARVRVVPGSGPGWRQALLLRDWLRADQAARGELRLVKEHAADADRGGDRTADYARATSAWFHQAASSSERWATVTGWAIPGPVHTGLRPKKSAKGCNEVVL